MPPSVEENDYSSLLAPTPMKHEQATFTRTDSDSYLPYIGGSQKELATVGVSESTSSLLKKSLDMNLKENRPLMTKPISRDSFNRVGLKNSGLNKMQDDYMALLGHKKALYSSQAGLQGISDQLKETQKKPSKQELRDTVNVTPNWLMRLDQANDHASSSGQPSFMQSKENLHNFKNKLLYMDGNKTLKIAQMY